MDSGTLQTPVNRPWAPILPEMAPLEGGYAIRELPPDQWHRLSQVPGPFHGVDLPPSDSCRIVVVENQAGEIVMHWPVFDAIHLDGLWTREDVRHHSHLQRVFLGAIVWMLQQAGVRYAHAIIREDDVERIGPMAETMGLLPQGRAYAGVIPAPEGSE